VGVLDDAIREHLDLKRRRGATDDELAQAEAEALGPARRGPSADDDDDEGVDLGETMVIQPMADPAPPPSPPAAATRAVHDIDEDPMPPPARVDRVERPDLDHTVVDMDTAEHAPIDQLPFDHEDDGPPPAAELPPDEDDSAPPAAEPPSDQDDGGSGRVSE
jgi:hypothetical protein